MGLNKDVKRNKYNTEKKFYSDTDWEKVATDSFRSRHSETNGMDDATLERYKHFRLLRYAYEKPGGIKEGLKLHGLAYDDQYPFEWDFSSNQAVKSGLARLS